MVVCSVLHCKNNWRNRKLNKNLSFYKFPKDEDMCNSWLLACQKPNINLKSARVCSVHFDKDAYNWNLKHKLLNYSPCHSRKVKPDAIPTLHMPGNNKTIVPNKSNRNIRKCFKNNSNGIQQKRHPTTYSAIQETSGHFQEVQIKDEPMEADPNDCRLYQDLLNTIKTEPATSEYCSESAPTNSEMEKNINSISTDKEHFVNVKKECSDSSEDEISVHDESEETEQIPMFESVFVKEEPFEEEDFPS